MENSDQLMMFYQGETSEQNDFQPISTQKSLLLSKKIETAMKQKGFNRQQFASIMKVQPSIITRWLSGNHNFTVETLFEIEDQLGVQLIAIEKPIYKQMNIHMVVGSEPTQHLHSSLGEALSNIIPSQISYCKENSSKSLENCPYDLNVIEFFKLRNK